MAKADIAAATKLSDYRKKVLDLIGPLLGKEDAGKVLTRSVEQRGKELFDRGGLFSRAYERVNSIYPSQVDTAFIRKEVAPLKQELAALVEEGRISIGKFP